MKRSFADGVTTGVPGKPGRRNCVGSAPRTTRGVIAIALVLATFFGSYSYDPDLFDPDR